MDLKTIRAYLFDIDMTLVDSMKTHVLTYNEILNHFDKPSTNEEFFSKECMSLDDLHIFENIFKLEHDAAVEAVEMFPERYMNHLEHIQVYPKAFDTLQFLHDRKIPIGLVTTLFHNQAEATAKIILESGAVKDDIYNYFGSIRTSNNTFNTKPDPEAVCAAMVAIEDKYKRALAPLQVCMVGESVSDMQAGRGAGTNTVAVLTREPREKMQKYADLVVNDIAEFNTILRDCYK